MSAVPESGGEQLLTGSRTTIEMWRGFQHGLESATARWGLFRRIQLLRQTEEAGLQLRHVHLLWSNVDVEEVPVITVGLQIGY